MNKFTTLAAGVTLAVASIGAFAQGGAPTTPRIDQREANQQARIDAGVASRPAQPTAKRAASSASRRRSRGRAQGQGRRHRHAARAPPARADAERRRARTSTQQKHDAQTSRTAADAGASGAASPLVRAAPLSASARA